ECLDEVIVGDTAQPYRAPACRTAPGRRLHDHDVGLGTQVQTLGPAHRHGASGVVVDGTETRELGFVVDAGDFLAGTATASPADREAAGSVTDAAHTHPLGKNSVRFASPGHRLRPVRSRPA